MRWYQYEEFTMKINQIPPETVVNKAKVNQSKQTRVHILWLIESVKDTFM